MRIALICEKPQLATEFIYELTTFETNLDREQFTVGWANEHYHLNTSFTFPRGALYNSFPKICEPAYKPLKFDGQYLDGETRLHCRKGLSVTIPKPLTTIFINKIENSEFIQSLLVADVIYVVIDPGPSGFHTRLRVMEYLSSLQVTASIRHLGLDDLTTSGIQKALSKAGDMHDIEERAKFSLVRRYFDYNYLLNAYPIMGKTFEKSFGKRLEWPLSKHELQILFFMRSTKNSRLNDAHLSARMRYWQGTGKYKARDWYGYFGMGNPASRHCIIENLIGQNLLVRNLDRTICITDLGERLLEHMHPDCEDPDQVFRIYLWAQLPLDEAKAKIGRYIKTFFGKQKRFLSKLT